ncbi:ADP-ribosylation factor-like protein 6-interacting protein 4 [Paramacrobiotus metropolitanus]|uniref:ADP-ribosylation factor-like protein 6-interacting protein 4 n=1 Tax=Paramacrobiotus metropolitanus TaxID=2943436 RepID=UPI00244642CE|nr:ADP-ribosylation factor-like protein 6-interacting protein 4 [Paramacrobiotus metropolitanus]
MDSAVPEPTSAAAGQNEHAEGKRRKKKLKQSKKKRKRSRSTSSDSSSSDSRRKHKKRHKAKKKRKASAPSEASEVPPFSGTPCKTDAASLAPVEDASVSVRPRGPMTKEQWDAQQSVIRRVYDPDTGRQRLVRGTGEIVEEIVSRQRHLAINKSATRADGAVFQANLGLHR